MATIPGSPLLFSRELLPHGHRNTLEQVRETSINTSNWLGISHLPIIQSMFRQMTMLQAIKFPFSSESSFVLVTTCNIGLQFTIVYGYGRVLACDITKVGSLWRSETPTLIYYFNYQHNNELSSCSPSTFLTVRERRLKCLG